MTARRMSAYQSTRIGSSLWRAWRHVRQKGQRSSSRETRDSVRQFDQTAETHIRRISNQLDRGRFDFAPGIGVLQKKRGKKPRPIFIAPLENRIVQRSILNTLQSTKSIEPYIKSTLSYGARGVPLAIEDAYNILTREAKYYIKSDIVGFFTNIPRTVPLRKIESAIPERRFVNLLDEATKAELANLEELEEEAGLFPDDELGIAQGCALSCLMGDVLLHEFDRKMTGRGIFCLRYIDDFLLLGPTKRHVDKAFVSAQDELGKFGLRAYDPYSECEKAAAGRIEDGFEFLGCEIHPGIIRPSREAKKHLLNQIDRLLADSYSRMKESHGLPHDLSLVGTLQDVHHRVMGWGNQYWFCNDRQNFTAMDVKIDSRIRKYLGRYTERRRNIDGLADMAKFQRRLLGVHLLSESKSNPIALRLTE